MTIQVCISNLNIDTAGDGKHVIAVDVHAVDRVTGERTVMPTQTVTIEPGTEKKLCVWKGQELVVRERG